MLCFAQFRFYLVCLVLFRFALFYSVLLCFPVQCFVSFHLFCFALFRFVLLCVAFFCSVCSASWALIGFDLLTCSVAQIRTRVYKQGLGHGDHPAGGERSWPAVLVSTWGVAVHPDASAVLLTSHLQGLKL